MSQRKQIIQQIQSRKEKKNPTIKLKKFLPKIMDLIDTFRKAKEEIGIDEYKEISDTEVYQDEYGRLLTSVTEDAFFELYDEDIIGKIMFILTDDYFGLYAFADGYDRTIFSVQYDGYMKWNYFFKNKDEENTIMEAVNIACNDLVQNFDKYEERFYNAIETKLNEED